MEKASVISIDGVASIKVAPDYKRINITIARTIQTNGEAYEIAKRNSLAIIAVLESVGLDGSLVKMRQFDISENRKPTYEKKEFVGTQKNGYNLNQKLFIELPTENTKLNKICEAIASEVPFVEIELEDFLSQPREYQKKALSLAVLDAKEKAEIIATTLGCALGQIVEIKKSSGSRMPYLKVRAFSFVESSELDYTPEDAEISESISITWQLINLKPNDEKTA